MNRETRVNSGGKKMGAIARNTCKSRVGSQKEENQRKGQLGKGGGEAL